MGSLCEEAIASAAKGLIEGDAYLRRRAIEIESQLNDMEREVEDLSIRLLRREQPVAGDLRTITAAVKMITDMNGSAIRRPTSRRLPNSSRRARSRAMCTSPRWPEPPSRMVTDSVHLVCGQRPRAGPCG